MPSRKRTACSRCVSEDRIASILIIDDEEPIRSLLRRSLEQEGYEVHDAATGKDGLRRVRAVHLDLVITDLLMPDTDGIEVIIALRREVPTLPIIALTGGLADFDLLESAKLLGARRIMKKPFSIPALLRAVQEEVRNGSLPTGSHSRGKA